MNPQGQDSSLYFTILIVLEIVVLILSFIFESSLTFFNIIRIFSLIGAKCLDSTIWVIQYIIFALISALYGFDPVGLWISGRSFSYIQMVKLELGHKMVSALLSFFFSVLEHTSVSYTTKLLPKKLIKISLVKAFQVQMMEEMPEMLDTDSLVLEVIILETILKLIKGKGFNSFQVKDIPLIDRN